MLNNLGMMQFTLKSLLGIILTFFFFNSGFSQNSYWTSLQDQDARKLQINSQSKAYIKSQLMKLDYKTFVAALKEAPKRRTDKDNGRLMQFPNAQGQLQTFRVKEASIMEKVLQDKFPQIQSYVGTSVDSPNSIIRFSVSREKGLSSMVLSNGKTGFIEPYDLQKGIYRSYVNSAEDKHKDDFVCLTESEPVNGLLLEKKSEIPKNANDGQLRTFRMALACTVEYAQYHINNSTLDDTATEAEKKAVVLAAMNATMTRVNGIYERDLAVTMVLVDNEGVIFIGPEADSDPYTNNNGLTMLGENQSVCDENIGSENYDIGHVFSTGGGGVATLRSPCTSAKARGVTGSNMPEGDSFDIDYVAHEIGHQFGANHTQNNDCNRTIVSVEPGSGSTIMGYAGICAPNIQSNSDDYFNAVSIKEMWLNISQGQSSCASLSITENSAPLVDAGPDFSIPRSTPFVLKGSASDLDSNNLTYTWEQNDATPASMPPQPTSTEGPLFRSIVPASSPDRYMPALGTVLSGNLASEWEVLPSVGRTMNFTLTVRDNALIGGATNSDQVEITTIDADEPFKVLTPPSWASGSTQTLEWTLGGSDQAPINCEFVTIYFSENGTDFNTLIAENVPNTGSAEITLPDIGNVSGVRIKIEAVDNIFYSVTEPFNISSNPDFKLNVLNDWQIANCGQDVVTFNLNLSSSNGYSEEVSFTATGSGGLNFRFTPASLNEDGAFSIEVSNITNTSLGGIEIEVEATSVSLSKTIIAHLENNSGGCASSGNTDFNTATTGVIINDGETDILRNPDNGKPSSYSDFSDMVTDLLIDETYEMTINVNTDGNYEVITYVWIDWNQNCSFDDPGERYNLGTTKNVNNQPAANSPLVFTIPGNAVLGKVKMRVATKYDSAPGACESGFDGEVEDYSLNLVSSLSQREFTLGDIKIYPNPSQGQFNVQFQTPIHTEFEIQVLNIQGKSLFKKAYDVVGSFNKTLDLRHLSSGLYLVQVKDGFQTTTKKLIIK